MEIKFRDKSYKEVIVKFKRKDVLVYLHHFHKHSFKQDPYGLYDIEENTKHVYLYFSFKKEIKNFELVIAYVKCLQDEYLAFLNRLKARNELEEDNNGEKN